MKKLERSGFTLIEVLVTLTLLTFMLFSVASLQLKMRQQAQQLQWQTIALQQLDNMLATIMVGQDDVVQWNRENMRRLPQGQAIWQQNMLLLQWLSSGGVWNCAGDPVPHHACFSVMVVS